MNMTTTEQAYINGFVKRASEYGVDQHTAIELLKSAGLLSELVGQAKLKKHAGSFPIRPAKVRKGLKQPVNLGNAGTINETGLHVPHDQGRYLDSILHMKPSPKVESHLANLHNQFDIDDIVDSLSH